MENSRQYQTISAKEWWKVIFLGEKKFNLDGPDGFQKYLYTKIFQKGITKKKHSKEGF